MLRQKAGSEKTALVRYTDIVQQSGEAREVDENHLHFTPEEAIIMSRRLQFSFLYL